LKTGEVSSERFNLGIELTGGSDDSVEDDETTNCRKVIVSSSKGRKAFEKENAEKYKKKRKSAT
jgi:hypothetical protein